MKKAIAIILACLLLFALAACNKTDDKNGAPSSGNSGGGGAAGSPWMNANGTVNLDRVGHYDPNFDYTQLSRPRVIYVRQSAPDPNTERMAAGLGHWGDLMNMQFDGMVTANDDPDLFLTLIQTQIDQGYDALIIDPQGMIAQSVVDIMADNPDIAWMTFLNPARDYDSARPDDPGPLLHPFVGFDFIYNGEQCSRGLLDWKEEYHPDIPWEKVGYIVLRNAEIGVFNLIQAGSDQVMIDGPIPNSNHFVADVAAFGGGTTPDVAQQAVANILTTQDCDLWLVSALIEPYGLGAAVAATTLGITDEVCVISTSAAALIPQWNSGVETAWRLAWYTEEVIISEPIMGGLNAFLNGWAEPNTIWPQWVNINDCGEGRGGPYALMIVPAIFFDKSNYAEYLAWTDIYAQRNDYPDFPKEGLTRDSFPYQVPVPDYYKVRG